MMIQDDQDMRDVSSVDTLTGQKCHYPPGNHYASHH